MTIAIKSVDKHIYDIFFEKGWDNWVRIQRTWDKGTKRFSLHIVGGQRHLPNSVWNEIKERV